MDKGELVESGEAFKVDMQKMEQKIDEDNRKISNSTMEAFFEEFPFLTKFADKKRGWKANIQRIDMELLERGAWESIDGICSEALIILDKNGDCLTFVGDITREKTKWWKFWTEERSWNVGSALVYLKNIGKANEAHFVLSLYEEHLTLYKPPKGFTITGWLEAQIVLEREQLKIDISKIDTEADPK